MKNILRMIVFGFSLLIAGNAMAKFTYEGHLSDLSDNPLSNQSATIKIAVVPPATSCVLFMEQHTVLTNDKGFFSVQVGSGTDIDGLPTTLDGVFSNLSVITGMASCSYTPVASDSRRLKIDVDIGAGYETLGFIALGKAPQAAHADAVGGFNATNFVRSASTAPLLSSSDVTALSQLIAGTSTLYATSGGTITGVTGISPISVSGGAVPNITITQASASGAGYLTSGDWTTFNSKLGFASATSGDLTGTVAAPTVTKIRNYPVSATPPTVGQVLTYNGSVWSPTTPTAAPVISVNSRTGAIVLVSSDVSGFLGSAAFKTVGTSAGTVAAGDDSRLVNGLTTALPSGQAFIGNGTNIATARNIFLGDIRSSITPANPAFNIGGGCSPGNMISYFSPTDEFTCQPFGLTNSQVMSVVESGQIFMPVGSNSVPSYSFSGDPTTGIYSTIAGEIAIGTSGIERMRLNSAGKVGIGTSAPDSKLAVVGTMRATSISGSHYDNSTSGTFDFIQGNLISSGFNCASNITLVNFRDGGVYKIVIKDPATTMCTFAAGVGGLDSGAMTYKFSPPNGNRNTSSDTVYELSRFGNTVYVKWVSF